jgi:uncharacterized protein (DUF1330 family)
MKNVLLNIMMVFYLIFFLFCFVFGIQAKAEQKTINMALNKGQMFSVIAPIMKEDGESARNQYYSKVLPLGTKLGLKREGQIKVTDTVVGDFNAGALVFFSWPDVNAENKLYAHDEWAAMKALRPKGWEELRIYSAPIEQDTLLRFRADKHYTLAIAWTNSDNPDNYTQYLDAVGVKLKNFGGRFIYKMYNPRFEAHATDLSAPNQLTFVEWDSADGLSRFRQSPDIKAQSTLFKTGLNRFEFYRLAI